MAGLYDEAGKFLRSLTPISGRQAYFLDVRGTDSAAQLDYRAKGPGSRQTENQMAGDGLTP